MNGKVIGVITARMASTRLPGKVLTKLAGKSIFTHHVERFQAVDGLDGIFLATSKDTKNEALIAEAEMLGCGWYAGSEQDIVDRHIKLCEREQAGAVVRVTCDSPLFDIDSASRFVAEYKRTFCDYAYVTNMTMIQGTLSELISYRALLDVHKVYRGAAITMPIKENMDGFNHRRIEIDPDLCRPEYRLTIDEAVDVEMISQIYNALYKGRPLDLHEVYTWMDDNPEIAKINMNVDIKGGERYSANLTERPIFSIVASGQRYIILDEQKKTVEPIEFRRLLKKYFPELQDEGERIV